MQEVLSSEVKEMEYLKRQTNAQEEEEPWPEMIEFEPMPSCMAEYHSWRWKI